MTKKYKANQRGFMRMILFLVILLVPAVYLLDPEAFSAKPYILLPLLAPVGLVLWIYFDTSYRIEDGMLCYRSGFLSGKIDIRRIRKIEAGKTMWVGLKPALARNGLIIHYNTYDRIYLSPENNREMIGDLLAIHPAIQVIS